MVNRVSSSFTKGGHSVSSVEALCCMFLVSVSVTFHFMFLQII